MKNRWPDSNGSFNLLDKKTKINVNLLHTRLGIIYLDKRSNQPYTVSDLTLIYNGEIYNYIELK